MCENIFEDFFSFENKNKLMICISYLNVSIVLGDPNNHSVRFFFCQFFFSKAKKRKSRRHAGGWCFFSTTRQLAVRSEFLLFKKFQWHDNSIEETLFCKCGPKKKRRTPDAERVGTSKFVNRNDTWTGTMCEFRTIPCVL